MALLSGLQAYWAMDVSSGNVPDSTANANTLVNNNGVTYGAGLINNAAIFASTAYLEAASSASLSPAADISMSFWVKMNNLPSPSSRMIALNKDGPYGFFLSRNKTGDGHLSYFSPYINATSAASALEYRQTTPANSAGDIISTGVWHHLAFTYQGSTGTGIVYVDGVQSTPDVEGAHAINTNSNPVDLAGTNATYTNGGYYTFQEFDGDIDEMGIWNRVLSAAEITQLYNGGAGLAYPFGGAPAGGIILDMMM